jgi:hypothetical protein
VLDLTGWARDQLPSLPPDVLQFLDEVVRPTRTEQALKSYRGLAARWWTFWNTRESGFRIVRRRNDCVAVPAVAKYLFALNLPSAWVYANTVVVFDISRPDLQTLLLSPMFDSWARKYGGSLGETRRMKVAPVVRTFPLPDELAEDSYGRDWQIAALRALPRFGPGISDVLNRAHDPGCDDGEIHQLRELSERIYVSTTRAYGWTDLPQTLSFEDTEDGVRWSLPSQVRDELLRRLHELNQRQAAAPRVIL